MSIASHLRATSSRMDVSPTSHNWVLWALTLMGCAALVFGSGVDHNHTLPVAVDQDCVVCDTGNAKHLAVVCDLSTLLVFGFENEVKWTTTTPFLTRFSKSTPRAPPARLAFV